MRYEDQRENVVKPPPPAAPFMRIGIKGETWDPVNKIRIPPPTTETRSLVKQVCKTCIFIMGAFAGAVVCVMVLQAKGLIV